MERERISRVKFVRLSRRRRAEGTKVWMAQERVCVECFEAREDASQVSVLSFEDRSTVNGGSGQL